MIDERGNQVRKKRVRVVGHGVSGVASALAEAQGLAVVTRASEADLVVLETAEPSEVSKLEGLRLVIAPRRLKPTEVGALREAGAARVLDVESCLLDLAFAFGELLFRTSAEQRRYMKSVGGLEVAFLAADGREEKGRALVLKRGAAVIESSFEVEEGDRLILAFFLGGRRVPVQGRVACLAKDGFGIEFPLSDETCAPRLFALDVSGSEARSSRKVIRAQPSS